MEGKTAGKKNLEILQPEFWVEAWEQARKESSIYRKKSTPKWINFWNQISEIYHCRSRFESGLVSRVMKLMDREGLLHKDSVVLDIGCGPGTFTLPMASKVSQVVALDPAEKMLGCLLKEAKRKGAANILSVCRPWEEIDYDCEFDLVFAGFSPVLSCPESLMKMTRATRRFVFTVTFSRTNEFQMRNELWKAITGRPFHNRASHILYPFNLLYSMGFSPHLRFIKHKYCIKELLNHTIQRFETYFKIFIKMDRKTRNKVHEYLEKRSKNGVTEEKIEREVCCMWWKKASHHINGRG